MGTIETNDNTPQITETSATPEQKTPKPSWYTKIKDNPEALEKLKQKRKGYYNKLKLIRQSLPPELLPEKKPTKHYIITPEKNTSIMLNIIIHIKIKYNNILKTIGKKR